MSYPKIIVSKNPPGGRGGGRVSIPGPWTIGEKVWSLLLKMVPCGMSYAEMSSGSSNNHATRDAAIAACVWSKRFATGTRSKGQGLATGELILTRVRVHNELRGFDRQI